MTEPGHPSQEPVDAPASEGGTGAPPDPAHENRVFERVTREYASADIKVQWFASRCIHSAACIRALPEVFDPRKRPWVNVNAATALAIADAVVKCPTGALHFVRTDGGPQEQPPELVTITTVKNGPYCVRGRTKITDANGDVVRDDWRVALCRCGRSRHLPFCDNSHRALGVRVDDQQTAGDK